MKKLTLIISFLGALIFANAQFEIKYNRFRHSREEYIAIGRDLAKLNNIDCNEQEVTEGKDMFKSIFYSDTSSVESKRDAMWHLGHINCQDVIDFYVDILKNDTSKDMRYNALLYLGWIRAKSSIPFLLESAKKENDLSFINKVATTLCVMEEFELASDILDRVCLNEDGSVRKECIGAYAFAGKNELVKNFFLSEWEKDNDEETKFSIALRLTEYGIYDITFPILKEVILGTDTYKRHSAIHGLAAIATEEALELIQNCLNDKDIVVANYADFVITCLKEGRDYFGRRDK
jgi:HEAT repeat protein